MKAENMGMWRGIVCLSNNTSRTTRRNREDHSAEEDHEIQGTKSNDQ